MQDYGDPLVAGVAFLLALSMLRVNGFFAKLVGLTAMAYVFAQAAGVPIPTVAALGDWMAATLA